MRTLQRLALILVLCTVAGGPLLAAPVLSPSGPAWTTPTLPATPLSTLAKVLAGAGAVVVGINIRKDTGTLAQKFVTRAGAAVGDYKAGVQAAGGDWETATKAAESSYEQGVQESIAQKRFGKGVSGAGGKYQKNATELGATRYQPGVANAQGAWAAGVSPYLEKLKSLQLPPKGPRRSPQNQQRANMVALELGKLRTGQ